MISTATLRCVRAVSDQNIPSITRVAAGAFGFLTLIQLFDGPERYGALSFSTIAASMFTKPRDPEAIIEHAQGGGCAPRSLRASFQ